MASGKSSRAKGVAGERESADIFRAHGFEVVRLQNNVLDAGDFTATRLKMIPGKETMFPVHDDLTLIVDSKRRERLNIVQASKQVEFAASSRQVGSGLVPCVAYRPNREPWRVSLRLEDFAWLLGGAT